MGVGRLTPWVQVASPALINGARAEGHLVLDFSEIEALVRRATDGMPMPSPCFLDV